MVLVYCRIFRNSLFAATLSLACSAPVVAAPVNVDFSFDSTSATFYGLDDDVGVSAASSFDYVGRLDSYSNLSTDTADCNSFTFDAGGLTEACFSILFDQVGDTPTGVLNHFTILFNSNGLFGGSSNETSLSDPFTNVDSSGDLAFEVLPATVVPLPSGSLLLLTGIAAVGGLRFRKKRAAQV